MIRVSLEPQVYIYNFLEICMQMHCKFARREESHWKIDTICAAIRLRFYSDLNREWYSTNELYKCSRERSIINIDVLTRKWYMQLSRYRTKYVQTFKSQVCVCKQAHIVCKLALVMMLDMFWSQDVIMSSKWYWISFYTEDESKSTNLVTSMMYKYKSYIYDVQKQ